MCRGIGRLRPAKCTRGLRSRPKRDCDSSIPLPGGGLQVACTIAEPRLPVKRNLGSHSRNQTAPSEAHGRSCRSLPSEGRLCPPRTARGHGAFPGSRQPSLARSRCARNRKLPLASGVPRVPHQRGRSRTKTPRGRTARGASARREEEVVPSRLLKNSLRRSPGTSRSRSFGSSMLLRASPHGSECPRPPRSGVW